MTRVHSIDELRPGDILISDKVANKFLLRIMIVGDWQIIEGICRTTTMQPDGDVMKYFPIYFPAEVLRRARC